VAKPEKKVKDKVRAILDSFGAYHFMPATHGYGASGTADIIACYRGAFIAIECKATESSKPTALQRLAAQGVVHAGGFALLIHAGNTEQVSVTLTHIGMVATIFPQWVWPGLFDEETP
jgi:hypothetical protein